MRARRRCDQYGRQNDNRDQKKKYERENIKKTKWKRKKGVDKDGEYEIGKEK